MPLPRLVSAIIAAAMLVSAAALPASVQAEELAPVTGNASYTMAMTIHTNVPSLNPQQPASRAKRSGRSLVLSPSRAVTITASDGFRWKLPLGVVLANWEAFGLSNPSSRVTLSSRGRSVALAKPVLSDGTIVFTVPLTGRSLSLDDAVPTTITMTTESSVPDCTSATRYGDFTGTCLMTSRVKVINGRQVMVKVSAIPTTYGSGGSGTIQRSTDASAWPWTAPAGGASVILVVLPTLVYANIRPNSPGNGITSSYYLSVWPDSSPLTP